MKLLLYMVILAAVLLVPSRGTDVGKLIPVEVVAVSQSAGVVTVRTDTGDLGRGYTLQEAMDDMKASALGVIYLDTAEYLILEEGMEETLNTVERHLKGNVRLCSGAEEIPLDGIADFLSVHKPEPQLRTVSDFREIPRIREENGRYFLEEK